MTVADLQRALADAEPSAVVVVSNVRACPFAVLPIKEVKIGEEGPVYIRAERKDQP